MLTQAVSTQRPLDEKSSADFYDICRQFLQTCHSYRPSDALCQVLAKGTSAALGYMCLPHHLELYEAQWADNPQSRAGILQAGMRTFSQAWGLPNTPTFTGFTKRRGAEYFPATNSIAFATQVGEEGTFPSSSGRCPGFVGYSDIDGAFIRVLRRAYNDTPKTSTPSEHARLSTCSHVVAPIAVNSHEMTHAFQNHILSSPSLFPDDRHLIHLCFSFIGNKQPNISTLFGLVHSQQPNIYSWLPHEKQANAVQALVRHQLGVPNSAESQAVISDWFGVS